MASDYTFLTYAKTAWNQEKRPKTHSEKTYQTLIHSFHNAISQVTKSSLSQDPTDVRWKFKYESCSIFGVIDDYNNQK